MVWALSLALALLQTGQHTTPFCGSRARDIGKGFTLTQYMFDGAPNFSLAYWPPTEKVKTEGLQATSEFPLVFSNMHLRDQTGAFGLERPRVFLGYPFVMPDGVYQMKLECGGDIVLALPSFNQLEQQCIQALIKDGSFRLSATNEVGATLSVIAEDQVPLGWAVTEAERIWSEEIAQARDGRCRLMSSPPPPF